MEDNARTMLSDILHLIVQQVKPKCVSVTVVTHQSENETLPDRLIDNRVKDDLEHRLDDGIYDSEVCLTHFFNSA